MELGGNGWRRLVRVEWVEMGVVWWCRVVVGDPSEDGEGDGWSWAELGGAGGGGGWVEWRRWKEVVGSDPIASKNPG